MLMWLLKKKFVFTIRFDMKKDKKEKNDEPLVSLRRPGSAEQVRFFNLFRSNGGKREARARAGHVREEE